MSKTIFSLIAEAQTKWDFWLVVAGDEQELKDRDKTFEQAMNLANFYEGRFDGLCDARDLK